MGAITGTRVLPISDGISTFGGQPATEMPGNYRIAVLKCTPGSASDTITLNTAANLAAGLGISEIYAILGTTITAGSDANLVAAQVTRTTTGILTVVTKGADGANATDWTGAVINIAVLGR